MTKDDLWMIKRRGALMRAVFVVACFVVKDMAMRYSKGEIDDEPKKDEPKGTQHRDGGGQPPGEKWMEQRKLNTVKRRPAATGVTGETKVVKGQAGDTEAEPDRQHEEAQTKARRKGAEKAQKRARVNTPANAISPPPLPPRRLQRMVHDVTAIWQRESTAGKALMAKHCWLSTDGKALLAEGVAV